MGHGTQVRSPGHEQKRVCSFGSVNIGAHVMRILDLGWPCNLGEIPNPPRTRMGSDPFASLDKRWRPRIRIVGPPLTQSLRKWRLSLSIIGDFPN
jgi:hypothetical protein